MIAAVVLAAGLATRMGRPKQILKLDGVTMLERVLWTLREASLDKVVVVLGAHAAEVRRAVKFEGEKVIVNRAYRRGMSTSLRAGLGAVEKDADAVMVVLGDQPLVTPATVDAIIQCYRKTRAAIVVPVHRGVRGNPVLLDRSLFPEIEKIRGDVGAKSVVARHEEGLVQVDVDDPGILRDIDTPTEYRAAVGELDE